MQHMPKKSQDNLKENSLNLSEKQVLYFCRKWEIELHNISSWEYGTYNINRFSNFLAKCDITYLLTNYKNYKLLRHSYTYLIYSYFLECWRSLQKYTIIVKSVSINGFSKFHGDCLNLQSKRYSKLWTILFCSARD